MSGVEVGLAELEVEVQAEAETLIEKVEMKVILPDISVAVTVALSNEVEHLTCEDTLLMLLELGDTGISAVKRLFHVIQRLLAVAIEEEQV